MIKIGNKFIASDSSVFIIAEAGVNHNGSLDLCFKMIDAAVEAGADAIKFQTFKVDNMITKEAKKAPYQLQMTDNQENQYEMLKKLELSFDDYLSISKYCRNCNILFLSTPFDEESVDLLERIGVPAYKMSSGDITNLPLLNYSALKNKSLIISTGMASLGEVEEAVQTVRNTGNHNFMLLHCTSNYPTDYEDVNLRAIQILSMAFNVMVGYSDHTLGCEVPIAAVALGAKVIEKHFTLDRNLPGPDQKASMEPGELKELIKCIRHVELSLGNGIKQCQVSEEDAKKVARKSIVANLDIPEGVRITREMLSIKRPGTGLPPKFIEHIVGRKARKLILKDRIISLFDLE